LPNLVHFLTAILLHKKINIHNFKNNLNHKVLKMKYLIAFLLFFVSLSAHAVVLQPQAQTTTPTTASWKNSTQQYNFKAQKWHQRLLQKISKRRPMGLILMLVGLGLVLAGVVAIMFTLKYPIGTPLGDKIYMNTLYLGLVGAVLTLVGLLMWV
jgi:hypothetical protein